MDATTAYDFIEDAAIMAIMRGNFPPEVALHVAEILLNEDINVFELTMNSEQPIAAMQAIKQEFGEDVCVGMGTVLSVEAAQQVIDEGADFVVSPAFQPDVVQTVLDADLLMVPGVLTPTEAVNAWAMGVKMLKLFPMGTLGVDHFRTFFGPLNHMTFMCNGGIDADKAQHFIQAGATAVGVAGWLTGDGTWNDSRLRSRGRVLQNAVAAARTGTPPLREA